MHRNTKIEKRKNIKKYKNTKNTWVPAMSTKKAKENKT